MPEQYRGKRVLVVGGGDSALEAATTIAEAGAADVTISYRGDAFARAKARNRERLQQATTSRAAARVAEVQRPEDRAGLSAARLRRQAEQFDNDAVIVSAGGILPTAFLQGLGVAIETKHGTT